MATVLTNGGKGIVTNRIKGAGAEPLFVGWGTGAGTAAAADTTLFTESGTTRATGTSTQQTTTTTNDTYQVVGTLTAAGALAVTNAGLWDNATVGSGTLFAKGDFATVNLATGDAIQFTIKVQFT